MSTADDRARRAHQLLREFIDLDLEERAESLQPATEGDPQLRDELEALLAAADKATGFLEQPAFHEQTPDLGPERFVGQKVGDYVLQEVLGRGGMGTVFRARQVDPPRPVALKLMNPGLLDQRSVQRFRDEVRTLGRLEHPAIARLYASGAWDAGFGGVPWYAMELVEDARRLTDYAQVHALNRNQRVRLFLEVCDAVHHGHQRGVLHRDLKPANRLVDGNGKVRVIDFGVARVLGEQDQTLTRTAYGGAVGTVPYMSPEQFAAEGKHADVRSDVYALGVVLYELLTGCLPREMDATDFFAAARMVQETVPVRPSHHDPALAGDLEAVLFKALATEPEDRYQTVAELAADLGRYLAHRPVSAQAPTLWRQFRLLTRRHRTVVSLSVAALFVLVVALAVTSTLTIRLSREVTSRKLAQQQTERERARQSRLAYQASLLAAEAAWRAGEIESARFRLTHADLDLRNWEWFLLDRMTHPEPRPVDGQHRGRVDGLAFAPDGTRMVTCDHAGTVLLWTTQARPARRLDLPSHSWLSAAFSAEGDRIALGSRRGKLLELDVASFDLLREVQVGRAHLPQIAYTPDGSILAISWDGSVRVLAPGSSTPRELDLTFPGFTPEDAPARGRSMALHTDQRRFVTGHDDGVVRIWDLGALNVVQCIQAFSTGTPTVVAFHPLGQDILTGSGEGVVQRWHRDGTLVWEFRAHERIVREIAVHPQGETFVTASADGTLRLWSFEVPTPLGIYRGHVSSVSGARVHPGGEWVATCSWDSAVGFIAMADLPDPNLLHGHDDRVLCVAFSPDPATAASGDESGMLAFWDLERRTAEKVRAHGIRLRGLDFRRDGTVLATAGQTRTDGIERGEIVLWDVSGRAWVRRIDALCREAFAVRFCDVSGDRLASSGNDGVVRLWSSNGDLLRELRGHEEGNLRGLAVHPRGTYVAAGGADTTIRIWQLDSGELAQVLTQHSDEIYALAFSPDGRRLASAGRDRRLCLWDVEHGTLVDVADGHGQFISGLAWHPSGQRLAAASWSWTVQIWQTEPLTELLLLHDQPKAIRCVDFSPDGHTLLSGGYEQTLRLWNGAPRPPE